MRRGKRKEAVLWKPKTASKGLSLIEVLFALLILSFAVAPFYALLRTLYRSTERIEDEILATSYAVSVITLLAEAPFSLIPVDNPKTPQTEQLMSTTLDELPDMFSADASAFSDVPDQLRDLKSTVTKGFDVEVVIEEHAPTEPLKNDPTRNRWGLMKKVVVRVTWQARLHKNATVDRSVTLATLLAADREIRM